jgi:hypothetical protein
MAWAGWFVKRIQELLFGFQPSAPSNGSGVLAANLVTLRRIHLLRVGVSYGPRECGISRKSDDKP